MRARRGGSVDAVEPPHRPRCGGAPRAMAVVEPPDIIRQFLEQLGGAIPSRSEPVPPELSRRLPVAEAPERTSDRAATEFRCHRADPMPVPIALCPSARLTSPPAGGSVPRGGFSGAFPARPGDDLPGTGRQLRIPPVGVSPRPAGFL